MASALVPVSLPFGPQVWAEVVLRWGVGLGTGGRETGDLLLLSSSTWTRTGNNDSARFQRDVLASEN